MNLQKRIDRLESHHPRQRRIEDLSSNELAELVTGIEGVELDAVSDEYLEAIVRSEQPALL